LLARPQQVTTNTPKKSASTPSPTASSLNLPQPATKLNTTKALIPCKDGAQEEREGGQKRKKERKKMKKENPSYMELVGSDRIPQRPQPLTL
jgi:hypothetical protein